MYTGSLVLLICRKKATGCQLRSNKGTENEEKLALQWPPRNLNVYNKACELVKVVNLPI